MLFKTKLLLLKYELSTGFETISVNLKPIPEAPGGIILVLSYKADDHLLDYKK